MLLLVNVFYINKIAIPLNITERVKSINKIKKVSAEKILPELKKQSTSFSIHFHEIDQEFESEGLYCY